MHITKLQEKKDKFKHGLGGLQKVYDMVPHSWIIATMKMVGLADNIRGLIKQRMNKWKTKLYADENQLGLVPIRSGIFQGDSFSPLLFLTTFSSWTT